MLKIKFNKGHNPTQSTIKSPEPIQMVPHGVIFRDSGITRLIKHGDIESLTYDFKPSEADLLASEKYDALAIAKSTKSGITTTHALS